ncbi:MAG: hypothetical protein RR618_00650 [Cellulosilyticaceae bacterium]
MNKRHELLRRLIFLFIGCIIINIGAAQVYTLQAKPKSGSTRSSSSRSSSKSSSSKMSSGSFSTKSSSSSGTSSSNKTSGKVNSGSFSSKKNNSTSSSSNSKVNSGSFNTSKPKDTSNTTTIGNTGKTSTSYGNTGMNMGGSIFSRSLFGSWYYRMPIIRYISPSFLLVVLLLAGLFIGYLYWKRHL